jgi:hypothetical protein
MCKFKWFVIICLAFCNAKINSQVVINSTTIEKYKKFEATITVNGLSLTQAQKNLLNEVSGLNNYNSNQIYLEATFTNGTTQKTVNGFYYRNGTVSNKPQPNPAICTFPYIYQQTITLNSIYGWKVRFTPTIEGSWTVKLVFKFPNSSNPDITIYNNSFSCTPATNPKGGFIEFNNTAFKYSDGSRFIPLGLDVVSWPEFTGEKSGSNLYDIYFQRLAQQGANMVRIFIDDWDALFLVGPSYTVNENNYNKFNQACSIQLDSIVKFAERSNIKIQLCFNMHVNGWNNSWWQSNPYYQNATPRDPALGALQNHGDCVGYRDFWEKTSAKDNFKNMIRYVLNRWAYSPSVFAWELVNEADGVVNSYTHPSPNNIDESTSMANLMRDWHIDMSSTLRTYDSYKHLITTSINGSLDVFKQNAGTDENGYYYFENCNFNSYRNAIVNAMDFDNPHLYIINDHNGQYGSWLLDDYKEKYFAQAAERLTFVTNKPILNGEASRYNIQNIKGTFFECEERYDPGAMDFHSSQWSNLFNPMSGPYWSFSHEEYINRFLPDNSTSEHMKVFKPLSEFMKNIDQRDIGEQKSFKYKSTGLSSYYFIDQLKYKAYGWVQNNNFSFEKLIGYYTYGSPVRSDGTFVNDGEFKNPSPYLKDPTSGIPFITGKPTWPSTNDYISFQINTPSSGTYSLTWYNTETGLNTGTVQNYNSCGTQLILSIPSSLRNGKFGDIAYIATLVGFGEPQKAINGISGAVKAPSPINGNTTDMIYFTKAGDSKIGVSYVDPVSNNWTSGYLIQGAPPVYSSTGYDVKKDWTASMYYAGTLNGQVNIYNINFNGTWNWTKVTNSNIPIKTTSEVHFNPSANEGFYIGTDGTLAAFYPCNSTYWCFGPLNASAPKVYSNTGFAIIPEWNNPTYYASSSGGQVNIYKIWWDVNWKYQKMTNVSDINIRTDSKIVMGYQNSIGYYVRNDGYIGSFYNNNQTYWSVGTCTSTGNVKVKAGTGIFVIPSWDGQIFYIGEDGKIYRVYWNNTWQTECLINDGCFIGGRNPSDLFVINNRIFFVGSSDNKIHYIENPSSQSALKSTNFEFETPAYFPDYAILPYGEEEHIPEGIDIFPNPNNGDFKIISNEDILKVEVFDVNGTCVLANPGVENRTIEISLNDEKKGVYIIKITTNKGNTYTRKIVTM